MSSGNYTIKEITEEMVKNKQQVMLQIPSQMDVNHQLKDGRTALMFACCNDDLNIVIDLCKKGANQDLIENEHQNTALLLALSNKRVHIAKYLINNGANIHKLNIFNENALLWAVLLKNAELVELLCSLGADLTIFNNIGLNSMFLAIQLKQVEIAKILIKYKFPLEIKEKQFEDTPLLAAMKCGEIASLLIDSGANIHAENKINDTPIHLATLLNNFEIVKKLTNKGADLNRLNKQSHNPIIFATGNGFTEIVKFLLEKNVDLNVYDVCKEPLLNICIHHNRLEIMELLLIKDNTLVNRIDCNYSTPITIAVKKNKIEFVELLLKYGATPNPKMSVDFSPIYEAFENKNEKIIELLIKHGVNKKHLLSMYIFRNKIEEIGIFIKNNPNIINQRIHDSNTALMIAALNNNMPLVELLLVNGADPNINNCLNRSPLMEAVFNGNYEMIKMLICYKADINNREIISYNREYGNSILGFAKRTFNQKIIKYLEKLNAVEAYEVY